MRLRRGSVIRSFLALEDTPASYAAQALKAVRVNAGEDALEFAVGVGTFLGLTDTPADYAGQAGKAAKVNVGEDALEFGAVGGEWAVVSEINVGENCDYVDFTSLDINTDKLYILILNLKNASASTCHYRAFVEEDYTLTNYYSQWLSGSGGNTSQGRSNAPDIGWTNAGEGMASITLLFRDPYGYFRSIDMIVLNTGSAVRMALEGVSKTATVVNITSLRIAAEIANGIGAGSHLLLCKPRG